MPVDAPDRDAPWHRRLIARSRGVARLAKEDELTLVAAGIAFYAFLALVPALVATATIYGLVADPAEIAHQVHNFASALPRSTQTFLTAQLRASSNGSGAGSTVTAAIAVLLAFWSASAGTAALLRGLAVINDAADERSFARRRGLALVVTIGAVVVVLVAVWLITVLPPQLDAVTALGDPLRHLLAVLRWPVLALLLMLALRGLYHVSAGYHAERFVTPGPVVAAILWLAASGLFSIYTANFSSLASRYGTVSSIIVVLLWLYLGGLAALIGAEVDAAVAPGAAPARDRPSELDLPVRDSRRTRRSRRGATTPPR